MRFDIITIFPKIFDSYLNESIIKRAQKNKKIKISIINLRDFALRQAPFQGLRARQGLERQGKRPAYQRQTIDEKPYGGGPGMVFKIEPIAKALGSILNLKSPAFSAKRADSAGKQKSKTLVILFSASGKQFDSKIASDFAKKYDRIVMIAGHYEGIDERIKSLIKDFGFKFQEVSIGPYVLTGGELPAMVVVDAVSRHIPGVLGKEESLEEKRYGVGVPMYTRPEIFVYHGPAFAKGFGGHSKKYKVPKVLLSGNHKKIEEWRKKHQK